jgi:hypothetical protein
VKDGRPKTYRTVPLKRMLGSYLKSRHNDIVFAEKAGRWLNEVTDAIGPTVRIHKEKVRIFEPNYTRG